MRASSQTKVFARADWTWFGAFAVAVAATLSTRASEPAAQTARHPAAAAVSATADFDEDGVPDVIHPDALLAAGVSGLIDVIVTGDFDADGHFDAITAAMGSDALFYLRGNGHGGFNPPELVSLPGGVTALAAGDVNRRDGLADLVVAIRDRSGASHLLVFEDPAGAMRGTPESFALPEAATRIAIDQMDGSFEFDVAVAAGKNTVFIGGRDRHATTARTRSTSSSGGLRITSQDTAPARARDALTSSTVSGISGDAKSAAIQTSAAVAGTIFVVNSTADSNDLAAGDGQCRDSAGLCTLRAAIQEANATAGVDAIHFTIPGAGVPTITLTVAGGIALPPITDPVTIDGTTQAAGMVGLSGGGLRITAGSSVVRGMAIFNGTGGFGTGAISLTTNGGNLIEGNYLGLDPAGAATNARFFVGVYIQTSSNNIIGGTTAAARNIISNNSSGGVYLDGANGTHQDQNVIQGNYIGTDPSGTIDLGNPSGAGVVVFGATTTNTVIGGTTAGAGNLISGNGSPSSQQSGIRVASAIGTLIQGNRIGTNAAGTAALENALDGITVDFADNATIGGTSPAARNLISGNARDGVRLNHNLISTHIVQGNFIGTDVSGLAAIANGGHGLDIIGAGTHAIGGTVAGAGNLISGNGLDGILFTNFTSIKSSNTTVQGNLIGTNVTGLSALPNLVHGLELAAADGTQIGGTTSAARNIISGNGGDGVRFGSTNFTRLEGNYIGVDASSTGPLGNGVHGVLTGSGFGDIIGGTAAGAGNIIAFNAGDGIASPTNTIIDLGVLSNSIFSNGGLGLDRGNDGVTAFNSTRDDNSPVVTSANTAPAGTTISGTLRNFANGITYTIQLFANPTCDSSGAGEGQMYIGQTTVATAGPNTSVPWSALVNPPIPGGYAVTAVAIGPDRFNRANELFTSEFSTCSTVAASLTVLTSSLPNGEVGVSYSAPQLAATGGTGNYNWSVTGGSLPNGVTLSSSGNFSGPPTSVGTFPFTVQVDDGSSVPAPQALSITIIPAVAITTNSLPAGEVGVSYSGTLSLSGGSGPFTWSLAGGSLPQGVTLSPAGILSGTPTAAGAPTATFRVTDALGGTSTKSLPINIAPALSITTASLPDGTGGTSYSATLAATGGSGALNWTVSAGSLPAGLSLSSSGTISGTPTFGGTSSFTVQVADSLGGTATRGLSITTTGIAAPLVITTTSLPAGREGTSYTATLTATGGTNPLTWSLASGSLPAGLTLSAAGVISGTPTVKSPGTSNFTVRVRDSLGVTTTQALSIDVAAARHPKGYFTYIDPYDHNCNRPHCLPTSGGLMVVDLVTGGVIKTLVPEVFTDRKPLTTHDGSRVLALEIHGVLDVIDTATDTIISTIPFSNDVTIAYALAPDDSKLYVVSGLPKWTLTVIDLHTFSVAATYAFNPNLTFPISRPADIALSPDGSRAYISTYNQAQPFPLGQFYGELITLDTSNGTIVNTISLGSDLPNNIVVNHAGNRAYVVYESTFPLSSGVAVIDLSTNSVMKVAYDFDVLGFEHKMFLSPDEQRLYVTKEKDELLVFSTATMGLLPSIVVPGRALVLVEPDPNDPLYVYAVASNRQKWDVSVRHINLTTGKGTTLFQFPNGMSIYEMAIVK
jgi:CSLREA domain-containing protein